jgi:TatA/E family protein of Tat protein translocase
MSIGPVEIVIVLALALLVFGPQRLPQMGRALGRSMREFRKASDDIKSSLSFTDDELSREDADAVAFAPPEPAAAPPEPDPATDDEAAAAPQGPAAPAAGGRGAA